MTSLMDEVTKQHAESCPWTARMERFRVVLERAAAREGIDVSALRWRYECLDQAWGDLMGWVFEGMAPEMNARAAECFRRWWERHAGPGSYNAQRTIRIQGEFRGSPGSCAVAVTYFPGAD